MADPRFFTRAGPFSLAELAKICGAAIHSDKSANYLMDDVSPLDAASTTHITFFDNRKYEDLLKGSRAGACILRLEDASKAPPHMALLVTPTPYKAYARIAQAFYPAPIATENGTSSGAAVHATAIIGEQVVVSPGAVIEEGASVGRNTSVGPNAVIGRNVVIGENCSIGACASISHALIGHRVTIYPGARIGQDGFGFAMDKAGHVKVPQLGRVVIEDDVEIGANTTIDRGAGPDTVIGRGAMIDNLVQIGHNVKIGPYSVIIAQVGISGSTVLEPGVVLAGQVGVAGHLKIGAGAKIGAQSGVMRDVPAGSEMFGTPAQPIKKFFRQFAFLERLIDRGKEST